MRTSALSQLDFLKKNFEELRRTHHPLWHPLGFASCRIKVDPTVLHVRVHFWPLGERRTKNPDWPIHTHTYHLSSLVLAGTIRDIQYRAFSGTGYAVYSVGYRDEDSELFPTNEKLSLEEFTNARREAGDCYSVERGVFHRSLVEPDESAVTLVALSDFSDAAPLVLGEEAAGASFPYDRTPFDNDRFWDAVWTSLAKWESD